MAEIIPRILLAGLSSGSGKTLITCGLLMALKNRGFEVRSFKCGPDYIDPMFHSRVLGIKSRNLDSYFAGRDGVLELFSRTGAKGDISVIEGVMGYYDGLAGKSVEGSTYEIASTLKAPVILIVNGKGLSVSMAALIKGMLDFRKDNQIKGIILNQVSPKYYDNIKELIEKEVPVKVLGYVPFLLDGGFESRHLGLVKPDEVKELYGKVEKVSHVLEETLDIDRIIALAKEAKALDVMKEGRALQGSLRQKEEAEQSPQAGAGVRIGVAKDGAFDFYYEENLALLEKAGAKLVYFSPLNDHELPKDISGILLGGGYPELYGKALSENRSMLGSIKENIEGGMPCLAECGGFMYLHEELEDKEGECFSLCGVIKGKTYPAGHLKRFGYTQLEFLEGTILGEKGIRARGHEFHYWESDNPGNLCLMKKPLRDAAYRAMVQKYHLIGGFPHLYYYSCPQIPENFVKTCCQYKAQREASLRWDAIAKPIGSLGRLEGLITKLAFIKGRAFDLKPRKKALVIMCADHGVVEEGVTQTDSSVTRIVSENFAEGKSCVNYMAGIAGADVFTIDIGMNTSRYPEKGLVKGRVVDRKIRKGSGNIKTGPAMTKEECRKALQTGIEIAGQLKKEGYDLIATGEMGIGNTTPSSALTAVLLKLSPEMATGRGAGLSDEGLKKKQEVIRASISRFHEEFLEGVKDPADVLMHLGGFDIAGMAGLFLGGVIHQIPIIIDGAISGAAALMAQSMDSRVRDYAIASHISKEAIGERILEALGLEAMVHCNMCLGEGSGAISLIPLLSMAAEVYENMSTFQDNGIGQYEKFTEQAESRVL